MALSASTRTTVFISYSHDSPANAARVLKETGCGAIKLEGGVHMAETIRYLSERGIPVMSHIGMTPQAVNTIGSFKPRGRFRSEWAAFEEDARAVAEAGAFAVVLEALAELLAARDAIAVSGVKPDVTVDLTSQALRDRDNKDQKPREDLILNKALSLFNEAAPAVTKKAA